MRRASLIPCLRLHVLWHSVRVAIVVLSLLNAGCGKETSPPPSVHFNFPSDASTIRTGTNVVVDIGADHTKGISHVDLYWQGEFVRTEKLTPFVWGQNEQDPPLLNVQPGQYTLKAQAHSKTGEVAEKSITITVEGEPVAEGYDASRGIVIESEDYIDFFDSSPENEGDCGEGPVDKGGTAYQAPGTCDVGWTTPTEWLVYDLHIPKTASYDIVLNLSSGMEEQVVAIEINDQEVGRVTANAINWATFSTSLLPAVHIEEGDHKLRVFFVNGGVNFDYIEFIEYIPDTDSLL